MSILENLFVFGWYPGMWVIWIGIMLAAFVEEPLEHNMMTTREIISNNLGCFLVGSVGRFAAIFLMYLMGVCLSLATPFGTAILFIGLMTCVVFNPGQILESDGFETVEI